MATFADSSAYVNLETPISQRGVFAEPQPTTINITIPNCVTDIVKTFPLYVSIIGFVFFQSLICTGYYMLINDYLPDAIGVPIVAELLIVLAVLLWFVIPMMNEDMKKCFK